MHVVYRASTSDDASQTGREEDQDEYFELYHDLFVKEIGRWNTDFKMALFGLQVLAWGLAAVASAVAYVGYRNAVRHHLEIGPRDQITVYRGDLGIPDLFSQRAFVKETSLRKGDLAPIHQEAKPVDFGDLTSELAGWAEEQKEIGVLLESGELDKALTTAGNMIGGLEDDQVAEPIERLALSRQPDAVRRIFSQRTGGDARRFLLLSALGHTGTANTEGTFKADLDDKSSKVKIAAAVRLARLPRNAALVRKTLLDPPSLLDDSDTNVRWTAVAQIAAVSPGDAEVEQRLVDIAKNDSNLQVRGTALASLQALHSQKAQALAMDVVRTQTDSSIVSAAARLLMSSPDKSLEGPLAELLDDKEHQGTAAAVLAALGDTAHLSKIVTALWQAGSTGVWDSTAFAAGFTSYYGEETLSRLASATDPVVGAFGLEGLLRRGVPGLGPRIAKMAPRPFAASWALNSLVALGDQEDLKLLGEGLGPRTDPVTFVSRVIALNEVAIRPKNVDERLRDILGDGTLDTDVRSAAASALAGAAPGFPARDLNVKALLFRLHNDTHEELRAACASALGSMGQTDGLADSFVLGTRPTVDLPTILDIFEPVDVVREASKSFLDTKRDHAIRRAAAQALTWTGTVDAAVVEELLKVAGGGDGDAEDSDVAVEVLGGLGVQRLVPKLGARTMATESGTRAHAVVALGSLHVIENAVDPWTS